MRRAALIAVISTAAVLFGGGPALAWDVVASWSGASTLSWGRANTYATHISQEWTPTIDTMICDMRVKLSQQTGDRSLDIGWVVRRGMTSNPETGGSVVVSGSILAPDVPTVATDIYFGTGDCWLATSGTKYGIDFSTGEDATNYLFEYYGADTTSNSQNWDYVPVTGWTARPTRELAMSLFGTTDASMFSAYVSSTYGFNDPDFGTFGNAIVDIAKWLFVPGPTSLNILASQREALMAKPPFVWAATASSTLGGLNTGDTTTSTAITWTVASTTHELFTPSTIASKIPANIQTLVLAVGATLMWAMFFAWIVSLATSGHITDHVGIHAPSSEGGTDDMHDDADWLDSPDATGNLDDI